MHRIAWTLLALSVVASAAAAFTGPPLSFVAGAGAAVLLIAGVALAWHNGRSLQRAWQERGVPAEIVLDDVRTEFAGATSTRCAIIGTVHAPGVAAHSRKYQTFVKNADLGLIVAGARLPATTLPEDPGAVRVRPHPDRPAWIQLRARPTEIDGGAQAS